jgi:integral membrane sensor domain MASE1
VGQDTIVFRTSAPLQVQARARLARLPRPTPNDLAVIVLTGLFYYAGARIGLLPALVRGQVTPFWPPTGIAVACLLVFGLRSAPGVAIAAFAVNAPLGPSVPAAAAIALGNTLAPLAVVLVLGALKVSPKLARVRDGVLFVVVAVSGMTISATLGTATLRLFGGVPADQIWSTWSVWWAGDAMGVLVIAPVLLQLHRLWPWQPPSALRVVEAVALFALVAVVMRYAMDSPAGLLVCPLLVWAAVRLRQLGAALVALEVAVLGSAAAASAHGPFAGGDLAHSMLVLQLFNAAIALTGLLLAAAITQLDDSRRDLGIANLLLSQKVEQRGVEHDRDRNRMAVLADRYRIATELHDTVLQRLFGVGAALQATVCECGNQVRLQRVVDELDATVNDLALAIYQVEDDAPQATFRDAIEHVIAASTNPLGLQPPALTLAGDSELIPPALKAQLLAALHDALSDMAARPSGGQVSIAVAVVREGIDLTITAEYQTPPEAPKHAGIYRAAARARRLGGSCEWHPREQQEMLTLQIPTA